MTDDEFDQLKSDHTKKKLVVYYQYGASWYTALLGDIERYNKFALMDTRDNFRFRSTKLTTDMGDVVFNKIVGNSDLLVSLEDSATYGDFSNNDIE